jgi:hypothetical protein
MQKVACRGEQATASAPQRAALGNTPAHARRGSADRGEHREAAGAIASVIPSLLSRQCGISVVSLVSRMNFFQFGASCSFPESIFFNWRSRLAHHSTKMRLGGSANIAKLPESLRKT